MSVRPFASVALVLSTREGARATLEALWSELPGVPIELLVHATGPARDVVLHEHGRRATLVGSDERPCGAALLELLVAGRARVGIVLAEGARPTPGWARELMAAALGLAPGLERAPGLAVPRLAAPALAGPQALTADPLAWPPTRTALRALADRARFEERRVEPLEHSLPSAACVALPRATLEQLGWADPRRVTLGGAMADLVRRARAAGLPVRLARRALVALDAPVPVPPAERERGPAKATPATRLALELEPDDPAAPALSLAARALVARGAPLLTFSRRPWPGGRPTPAPHVVAAGLAAPARASDLLLLRAAAADVDAPARRLLLPDEAEAEADDLAPLRLAGDPDTWPAQLLVLA